MTGILVTIAETLGSAPREPGTSMIVTADEIKGSIGGGALEKRAIETAYEMLAVGDETRELRLPLGPTLQQCCGGYIVLRLEETDHTIVAPYRHRETVYLYGAGHVGKAVADALSPLPFDLIWVDQRADWAPSAGFSRTAVCGDPIDTARAAVADAYHLIMTHDHGMDLALCAILLERADATHIGLIGSSTKKARFMSQLRARGMTQDQLNRLICPIGVVGITGKEPAIIAAGIAAELLLVRSRRLNSTHHRADMLHA